MTPAQWMILAVALPLGGVAWIALTRNRPNLRDGGTLVLSAVVFGIVVRLVGPVLAGERPEWVLVEVLEGIELAFRLEPLGLLFGLVASGLWIVTTAYSIGYMRGHHEKHQARFYACFAIAITAALGVAFARNLFTLFAAYEVLTLSTYPLVTHQGTEKARRAGRVYLGVLLTTSVGMLLFATVGTWVLTGTTEFTPGGILDGHATDRMAAILLALFAFGTGKAALMPFHRWLPAAMVAPTPVSALLHAVAVVKAGVFTVLKISVYIFGVDFLTRTSASVWLMYVAAFTIVAASIVAMSKDNLKARLAYSTISQLSYIVLGAALANSWGVIGGGMHILMHAFGKITLFFCAGAIYVATNKTEISDMRGIGRTMPVTTFAFLLGALSIIGLPPMGGTWSKWFLMLGSAEAHQFVLMGVLMISSLLNIAYLMPIPIRGFLFAPTDGSEGGGIKEAPLFCVVPLCFTALGCVALFFLVDEVRDLLILVVGP